MLKRQAPLWIMLLLLLLFTWLGGRSLTLDAIWHDEAWSLYVAGGGTYAPLTLGEVWERVATDDPRWAPGYFLILNLWGKIAGWEALPLRLLSLWGGLVAIALAYRLGREMQSSVVGVVTALTLGASGFFGIYLHEIRPYSWIVLSVMLCLWGYWRVAVMNPRGIMGYIVLGIGTLSTAYVHYYAALVPLAIGVWHGLAAPKNRRWILPLLPMTLAALLFLPWMQVVLEAVRTTAAEAGLTVYSIAPVSLLSQTASEFSNGNSALLLVFLGFALYSRTRSMAFIAFVTILTLVLAIVVNERTRSLTFIRYMMMMWGLLALFVGFGADELWKQRHRAPLVALLLMWALWGGWRYWDVAPYRDTVFAPNWFISWDALAQAVAPQVREQDTVLMHIPEPQERWTHERVSEVYLADLAGDYDIILRTWDMTDAQYEAQARAQTAQRVFYAYDPDWRPKTGWLFENALLERYVECASLQNDEQLHLRVYHRIPETASAQYTFGSERYNTPIIGSLLSPPPDELGDRLNLPMLWQTPADAPPYTYSVGLHILDANENLVAQQDGGLPLPNTRGCFWVQLDVSHLPAGEYQAVAVVYNWENGERLLTRQGTLNAPVLRFSR